MQVAFICGPYRAGSVRGIVENIRRAEKYALKYWSLGYAVFCPHMNTALFDGAEPDEVWLNGGLEFLRRSDVVVCIPGWENSEGSIAEVRLARALGKKIIEAPFSVMREV